ncbi:hypothetical protein IJ182_10720 [bacterium]|nr:hypothetical protein [bacterium]
MKINSINIQNTNTAYKPKTQKNFSAAPSFKGADPTKELSGASKLLAEKFYPWLSKTKGFQAVTTQLSKLDNSFKALLVAESCLLSGFYMINTATNPKIKKEQKPQMIINDTLTLGISTAGALLFEDGISDCIKKGTEKYVSNRQDFYRGLGAKNSGIKQNMNSLLEKVGEVAKEKGENLVKGAEEITAQLGEHLKGLVGKNDGLKTFQITKDKLSEVQNAVKDTITTAAGSKEAQEQVGEKVKGLYSDLAARVEADKFAKGMSKVKTLIVFGIIYRYIGPVVVTPIANKLSSKFFNNKKDDNKINKK